MARRAAGNAGQRGEFFRYGVLIFRGACDRIYHAQKEYGGVAQLVRAFGSHPRGHGFEPPRLQKKVPPGTFFGDDYWGSKRTRVRKQSGGLFSRVRRPTERREFAFSE